MAYQSVQQWVDGITVEKLMNSRWFPIGFVKSLDEIICFI